MLFLRILLLHAAYRLRWWIKPAGAGTIGVGVMNSTFGWVHSFYPNHKENIVGHTLLNVDIYPICPLGIFALKPQPRINSNCSRDVELIQRMWITFKERTGWSQVNEGMYVADFFRPGTRLRRTPARRNASPLRTTCFAFLTFAPDNILFFNYFPKGLLQVPNNDVLNISDNRHKA